MYIGHKIKEIRQSKGISLSELAQKSGVQIATLSRIEHMKMVGTLESHMQIAKALDVDITRLYSNMVSEEDKVDFKGSQKEADMFIHSDKSSYEILTSKVLNKKMMPIMLKIEPNGQTNPEQNPGGTEKFIYILDGAIEVNIAGKPYPLKKGNSLYFDASEKHFLKNTGKLMAKAVCVTTPVEL